MDTIYHIGPAIIAVVAALIITAYTWNRYRIASIITLAWATAAIIIGQIPLYAGLPEWQRSDWMGFLIFGTLAFAPAILLWLASQRVPAFAAFLACVPTSALVITQTYRFGGIALIVAYSRDQLPIQLGLVTGVLDVVVATTAIMLAGYLRGDDARAPRLVIAWATLAILDFGWAALLITGSFAGIIPMNPAPVMMGNPPLLIISLFALPLGIFISMVVIARMWRLVGTTPLPLRMPTRE
jgi:hypothetical protein